jgi:hypothetical protein
MSDAMKDGHLANVARKVTDYAKAMRLQKIKEM